MCERVSLGAVQGRGGRDDNCTEHRDKDKRVASAQETGCKCGDWLTRCDDGVGLVQVFVGV